MKLLLTSNGLTTAPIRQEFLRLAGKPATEIRIAFIPTAADPELDQDFGQQVLDRIKYWGDMALKEATLQGVKAVDIIDLKNFHDSELALALEKYDVIWVNGGNTFYLLDWVRRSGFAQIIRPLLEKGRVYVGSSAGSILATPTIEVAGWKGVGDPNIMGLENLNALHLVDFHILPHFIPAKEAVIQQEVAKLKQPIYILSDNQAMSVCDGKVTLIE